MTLRLFLLLGLMTGLAGLALSQMRNSDLEEQNRRLTETLLNEELAAMRFMGDQLAQTSVANGLSTDRENYAEQIARLESRLELQAERSVELRLELESIQAHQAEAMDRIIQSLRSHFETATTDNLAVNDSDTSELKKLEVFRQFFRLRRRSHTLVQAVNEFEGFIREFDVRLERRELLLSTLMELVLKKSPQDFEQQSANAGADQASEPDYHSVRAQADYLANLLTAEEVAVFMDVQSSTAQNTSQERVL